MYINCTATYLSRQIPLYIIVLSLSSKEAEFSKYFILSTYLQKYFFYKIIENIQHLLLYL